MTGADYLRDHRGALDVAAHLGVTWDDNHVDWPADGYARRRFLAGRWAGEVMPVRDGRVISGVSLAPWTPVPVDGWLLVCEGESDTLAAISALYELTNLADDDEDPDVELFRRDDLPPPLREAVPVGLPGAGACHGEIVALAREHVCDVVVLLDGDSAGRAAAQRLAQKCREAGVTVTVADPGDDRDLADVLAAADDPRDALANLIAEAEAAEEVHVDSSGPGPEDGDVDAEVEALPNDAVGRLLGLALGFLDRYVILPGDHERHAEALWAAHTWAVDGSHATPYLLILSPEKRSGKTRNQETIELLVRAPWRVTGASEAAMFRKIEQSRPTLLLDEIDAIFSSHSDRTEPLRAVLNSGNRPGASVARVVGESHEVRDFSVFCPKMLSGIDKGSLIPDTIRDRSITITMVRRTAAEPVERFRYRDADAEAQAIREGFQGWAVGAIDLLLAADPDLPHELDDRAAEAWEPLLAIADMAGGEWPRLAREAAVALNGQEDRDEVTVGTLLLEAVRDAIGGEDRITTVSLLERVNGDEELPFGGWAEGKGLDGRRLAKLLKPYGVRPRPIRIGGEVAKGYLLEQFEEVWERWLPPDIAVTTVTTVTPPDGVTDDSALQAGCNPVTAVTAVTGSNGAVTATEIEEAEIERIAAKIGGAS